jgi:RNA polymerase sporulation-specific sigma factor
MKLFTAEGNRARAGAQKNANRRECGLRLAAGEFIAAVWRRLKYGRPSGVMYIGGSDTLPPPLTREEETRYLSMMAEGSFEAKQTLIERNLRLVAYISKRFENTGVNIEDLISIGTIGLIKAINTYDVSKNIKLATYASRCIENEILMFLRKASNKRAEISFDEPLNTDWDGNELLLSDILGTDADIIMRPLEDDVDKKLLLDAVEKLTAREREIIAMRFGLGGGEELTQKEVADIMGISQSYISRMEKRIIMRLRHEISRYI